MKKKTQKVMEQWIAEMKAIDGGFSVTELSERMNVSKGAALDRVRKAVRDKTVRFVGFKPSVRMDGIACRVPVYCFTDE